MPPSYSMDLFSGRALNPDRWHDTNDCLSAEGNKNYNVLLLYRFRTRFIPQWTETRAGGYYRGCAAAVPCLSLSLSLYRVLIVAWSNHINVLDIIIIDVVALVEGLPPQDMSVVSSQPSSCGRRCCCYYYSPISRRVVVGNFEAEDTRNSPISTAAAD